MTLNFTNSDLRQKVNRLMDELWEGGVNNPMTAIEQTRRVRCAHHSNIIAR